MVERVQVAGLKELRGALKGLEGNFPKQLQQAHKRAVTDVIVPAAKAGAAARSGPRAGHAVVGSIRGLATQTSAAVAIGSVSVPWALGHEFGAVRFKQFPGWRGGGSGAGYFFYPAIRATREQFISVYGDMLENLTQRAFPE